jgi:hypothetical protein
MRITEIAKAVAFLAAGLLTADICLRKKKSSLSDLSDFLFFESGSGAYPLGAARGAGAVG